MTGWPPGMLQDDHPGLSRWLSNTPEARRLVRERCADIIAAKEKENAPRRPDQPDSGR
jgi:hypothetical protein